jgi:hypothetical protein
METEMIVPEFPIYYGGTFALKPTGWAEDALGELTWKFAVDGMPRIPDMFAYCATCRKMIVTARDLHELGWSGYGILRRVIGAASDHDRFKLNHAVFLFYQGRLVAKSPYDPLACTWP